MMVVSDTFNAQQILQIGTSELTLTIPLEQDFDLFVCPLFNFKPH